VSDPSNIVAFGAPGIMGYGAGGNGGWQNNSTTPTAGGSEAVIFQWITN